MAILRLLPNSNCGIQIGLLYIYIYITGRLYACLTIFCNYQIFSKSKSLDCLGLKLKYLWAHAPTGVRHDKSLLENRNTVWLPLTLNTGVFIKSI